MTWLLLSHNGFSGTIPTTFGNLTRLNYLRMQKNQLTGRIPNEFGDLTRLRQLDLSDNLLSGSIPASLGNLTELESLYLSNNQLSGRVPESLGRLTKLKRLQLHGNRFSDEGQAQWDHGCATGQAVEDAVNNSGLVADCEALLGLKHALFGLILLGWNADFPMSTWEGVTISTVDGAARVTALSLAENRLDGTIPPAIGNLAHLQTLDLSQNGLKGSIPRNWDG